MDEVKENFSSSLKKTQKIDWKIRTWLRNIIVSANQLKKLTKSNTLSEKCNDCRLYIEEFDFSIDWKVTLKWPKAIQSYSLYYSEFSRFSHFYCCRYNGDFTTLKSYVITLSITR